MQKTLDIYITKLCNLRCEYCYVDIGADTTTFSVDGLLAGIDVLSFDHIKFFGGEPLIKWNEICQIVATIRSQKRKMKFTIISNGILLDREKYDFIRANDISLVISVHPKPGMTKIGENLITFLTKKEIGDITFSFVLSPRYFAKNYRDILSCVSFGARDIIILPDSSVLWSGRLYIILQDCIQKVVRITRDTGVRLNFAFSDRLIDERISCKKSILEISELVSCNRFKARGILTSDFLVSMQVALEAVGFFDNPYRYFFSCPIGYFLDHFGRDMHEVARVFMEVNIFLIDMQSTIDTQAKRVTYLSISANSEIRFNLTNQCNLRCNYCYVDFDNTVLSLETAYRIIRYCLEIGRPPHIFSFFGGEPLLEFERIRSIVSYIEQQYDEHHLPHPRYKIATNALLLNAEKLQYLRDKKFEIHITLGGLPMLHDRFRDGSWDRLHEKMQQLSMIQSSDITFLLMIHPETIGQLFYSYVFLKNQGVQSIHMEYIYDTTPYFWTREHLAVFARELKKIWYMDGEHHIFSKDTPEIWDKGVYDISVSGAIEENSLSFHTGQHDLSFKKNFDVLFAKIFM